MKKLYASIAVVCFAASVTFAQVPEIGTPAYVQWLNSQNTQMQRSGGPVVQPQNGNDTLTTTYSNTACGLNYSLTSVRLGQRFTPIGLPQPAAMTVTAIPSCGTVLKAYLYTEALGVASSITATLTDPNNVSSSVPMTLIGSSVDVCWGMNGTHVWRADVTNLVSGSGTYMISGLPTALFPSMSAVDVEGASLLIIYADPTANYTGTIQIDDGCHTVVGGALSHTMSGFNACSNSTSGSAFMLVGDMQMPGYTITMNGGNVPQPQWNWWNEISASTNVTSGQTTCSYTMSTGGDCYTLAVAGLYYQTNCNACTPTQLGLTVNANSTNATCGNNGTATATATGGNGNYTYTWIPGNMTTASVSGLAPGVYTVLVSDGTTCGSATVSIVNTGMSLTAASTNSGCSSTSGSATVTVTGGTGPFSYSWAPSGGNAATATNLAAGSYTCTVSDASSCVVTVTVNVSSGNNLNVQAYAYPDNCPSTGSGYATVGISGGTAPFTFLWSNGDTNNIAYNLTPGVYCVTVTDAGGCTATSCDTVTTNNFWAFTSGWAFPACGDSVLLNAYCSDPAATYSWTPSSLVANPTSDSTMAYPPASMTFYVTVNSQCGTAFDSIVVYVDSSNYFVEQICFVTVDTSTNHNLLIWERNSSPSTGFYNIYRETAVSGVYTQIASQPISQFTTYLDVTSNPLVQPYRYQITTTDACGSESDTSAHHRSIHLQVSPSPFGGWNLSWTAYEGLPIGTYNIYRGTSISNLTLLTQVSGSVFTYTDLTAPVGPVYYLIEAVHPFGGCTPSRWATPGNTFDYISMLSNLEYADPNGINDNSALQNSLSISPNPGNGLFSINCNTVAGESVNVTITDALGRIVYSNTQASQSATFHQEIDLTSLSAGMYNVKVVNAGHEAVDKLVITQ